ncbi:hypothetical protein FB45DRAFT_1031732 [Roridomyces roridus]|uniref:GATA-type domain-containing protein n=1 Tax=Roridomyces roridus TaxID=1738132 RepID=A0AAD7FI86_9AGAR|nr:hypothetical protein FB45DRAFT_1031732 [Roridomyces roridus]
MQRVPYTESSQSETWWDVDTMRNNLSAVRDIRGTPPYNPDYFVDAEVYSPNVALPLLSPPFHPMALWEPESKYSPDDREYWPHPPATTNNQWGTYPSPNPITPTRTISLPCPAPSSPSSISSPFTSPRPGATPKCCSHCSATSTPLWRRHPGTHQTLCNACGLYLQQRHKMRPRMLIAADQSSSSDDELDMVGGGPECSHCGTRRTSVWRRSKTGAKVCNACGVYARLRGRERPLELRRNKIRPRCKHIT